MISKIKQVESEFENIYRITAENGLILDIPETDKPVIGSSIEYSFLETETEFNGEAGGPGYTIMNGILYSINNETILVSFGGLLGNIPYDKKPFTGKLGTVISIFYCIKN